MIGLEGVIPVSSESSDEITNGLSLSHALPDNIYSPSERIIGWSLLAVASLLVLGAIMMPSLFLEGFLNPYVIDPIQGDAEDGDRGYNVVNTMLYSSILFAITYLIAAVMRKGGLLGDERLALVLVPWVVWASLIRVLEDAEFFNGGVDWLFISPIIHFHIAGWVILSAVIGWYISHNFENLQSISNKEFKLFNICTHQLLKLMVIWFMLLQWILFYLLGSDSVVTREVGFFIPLLFLLTTSLIIWISDDLLPSNWGLIERSTIHLGIGSVGMATGFWAEYMIDSSIGGEGHFLPIAVIIGIPAIVCYYLYRYGHPSMQRLRDSSLFPGILPVGMSLKDWENQGSQTKALVEKHSPRAIFASKAFLFVVYGQLADGLATWMGVTFYGYQEKHVLGNQLIELGGFVWGGAWLFLLVKVVLVMGLAWVFGQWRFEHRHRHFRQLIMVALMVVGLAPGLRDLGRMALGV